MITRKNYEIYVIDYLEGNLNPEIKAEFEKFLEANPDIKEEITGLTQTVLSKKTHTFHEKWQLKKSSIENLTYTDELFISDVEGIATQVQKKEIAEITQKYPDLKKEYQAYQSTRLKPPVIFYPYKNGLKKTAAVQTIRTILSYAAMIILAITIFSVWQKPDKKIATNIIIPRPTSNLLLPADLTIAKDITRPVVITSNNTKKNITKQHLETLNTKPEKINIQVAETETKDKILENIAAKEFNVKPQITVEINPVFEQNLSTKYQNLILVRDISSNFSKKINKWARERGIIVSRNQFIIRINNKNYGISIAGR